MFYFGQERSNGETSFPGHRLLVSNDNTHKDPNFPNGTKKNESQQGEQHRKAGTSTSMFELWTDPDFDGMAYFQMERRKMRASNNNVCSSSKSLSFAFNN